jgi:hypothetical protein
VKEWKGRHNRDEGTMGKDMEKMIIKGLTLKKSIGFGNWEEREHR